MYYNRKMRIYSKLYCNSNYHKIKTDTNFFFINSNYYTIECDNKYIFLSNNYYTTFGAKKTLIRKMYNK